MKVYFILVLFIATVFADCQNRSSQELIDECYMKIALDYALLHNPKFPFGALIVNHDKNQISCYGANSNTKNVLLHGETSAFWNCTELYPSPTNNDMTHPGLNWSHQTLYTTGEPCPMCATQSIYRGVARVIWGTSIPDINRSGREQITIRMQEVIRSAKLGADQPNPKVPKIKGGILKDECDSAFWCAFAPFRDKKYLLKMKEKGLLGYIKDREARFKCPSLIV
ncbi:cytidine deaminase-like protein [Sporodiniella umbellata]|nr:cytidine deaminase-like protein [Sporodiniella umbellata]